MWLCVRADLRSRWRSWVVLGLLIGISAGLACAGLAGARRATTTVARYAAAAHVPDAAVLPNDFEFDDADRTAMAELPNVERVVPFFVPFALHFSDYPDLDTSLLPTDASVMTRLMTPLRAGRAPDPHHVDEIVVDETARDRFGLEIGSIVTFVQDGIGPENAPVPFLPPDNEPIEQPMRVVGIVDATGPDDPLTVPSSAFFEHYRNQLFGVTNAFVDLRGGEDDLDEFRADVDRLLGRPTNVEAGGDLFGVRQIQNVSDVERTGILLFALAVVVGAGALVGQALTRAVAASGAEYPTWASVGIDRSMAVSAMTAPALLVGAVAAVTTVITAVLLSPRFPIGHTRRFELDIGYHADWLVLGAGALTVALLCVAAAWVTAQLGVRRTGPDRYRRRLQLPNLPPALLIGSQLATDVGRGRRAVPVRSAVAGAIIGVLGVVGCVTFRSGLNDAVTEPSRSGVVWDFALAKSGTFPDDVLATILDDPAVHTAVHATWARAVELADASVPVFGTDSLQGAIEFEVLEGRRPRAPDEIAFAPTTMSRLGLKIGDTVELGPTGARTTVVGRVLLPSTSHTGYDQSAWMTGEGLERVLPDDVDPNGEFFEDYVLIRWSPGVDGVAAAERLTALGEGDFFSQPAVLPPAVEGLRALRVLPLTLAAFFGLLAVATVAHALVTTVRRRRGDLAVFRAIGVSRGGARAAIAWQATVFAGAGLIVGVPLGLAVGRVLWRQLAATFPVVYAAPLALAATVLVVPLTLAAANAIAVAPAHAATRIRPAVALRAE